MSFEKAKAYLKDKGLEDHIIVLNESSATVAEAASARLVSTSASKFIWMRACASSRRSTRPLFCVGINLVWPKTIKVANLLPSLLVAIVMTLV